MAFFGEYRLRAGHLFRELLARPVCSPVLRLNPNQVFRLEIDRPLVLIDVMLLFLLGECNAVLSCVPSVMYTLSEGYSLVLIQLFPSIYRRLRTVTVPVPGRTGLIPLKELERAYPNALIVQGKLRVVYHRNQRRPVVLVVINEGL